MIEITLMISEDIQNKVFNDLEAYDLTLDTKTDILEEIMQDLVDITFKEG